MASQHTKHEYMSSIKTTQIDGDVSVGRNVAIGGKADIAGSAHIGHNLKVDGWLEEAALLFCECYKERPTFKFNLQRASLFLLI